MVPVRCRCSRSASSKVVRLSSVSVTGLPFTSKATWLDALAGSVAGRCDIAVAAVAAIDWVAATLAADAVPAISTSRRVILMSLMAGISNNAGFYSSQSMCSAAGHKRVSACARLGEVMQRNAWFRRPPAPTRLRR
ncbi:hypothetical protein XFF6990_130062 [Xanthomonas citri pv. fuscans]|uniref:Uncharacterized protein n=1 Tax=Xanthomonas campestris pv. phaseoli TaxID=317013 RepID=A0A7Z7NIA6_XANCH|nr:hypothetical protein XFF6990_130062 [Xanthomonas citri pv. fuscans]SOO24452.1 hypothetical protein XFF6991_360065 [Xanthomonas phaseoli pv. phaseoli]